MDTKPEVESVAYEGPKGGDRGYTVKASYLKAPNNGNALIEIFKDGTEIRSFLYPAYRIYNISAHFHDIVDSELEKNDRGYRMADWNGISGAVFFDPSKPAA